MWGLAELPAHFRIHIGVAALALAAGLVLLRPLSAALAALLLGVALLWPAASLWADAPHRPHSAAAFRVLYANVYTHNRDADALLALIAERDPDVVALLEVNERWLAELEPLRDAYPHHVARPRDDNFGIALFSRIPMEGVEIRPLLEPGVPFVIATLPVGGDAVTFVLAHPVPPVTHGYTRLRDRQLGRLARVRREAPAGPFVLAGDLNASPWSPAYQRFIAETGLRNSALGFGLQPTWPTALPWLRIPIDFVLVSEGVAVLDHHVGPDIGSDHLPLSVDLALAGEE